jgi:hypothetical protein
MEDGQVIGPQGQVVVPNAYLVSLHPDDLQALASYQETLQDELVRYVAGLARAAGATMPGRPRVFLQANPAVSLQRVHVEARLYSPRRDSAAVGHTQEMPFLHEAPQQATAQYALFDGQRRMPIVEAVLSIGRGLENDVILDDPHVSRRHAQLRRHFDQYVLYDLNSAGGTTLNGSPIRDAPLQPGDVIAFAGVEVRFERSAAESPNLEGPSPNVTRALSHRQEPRGRHES